MRFRKKLNQVLVLFMIFVLAMGSIVSFAENNNSTKIIRIDPCRYNVSGNTTNRKYGLKKSGSSYDNKNVFQLYSVDSEESNNITGINYYCLNAIVGNNSWMTGQASNYIATYNNFYNLNIYENKEENNAIIKGIKALRNDGNAENAYSNIARSKYINEILWILDNIYIPTFGGNNTESDLDQKREFLNNVGIEYITDDNGFKFYKYKYTSEDNNKYNYTIRLQQVYDPNNSNNVDDEMKNMRESGWYYIDTNNQKVAIELTDDLVEVAQQVAIWYYTNYKNENTAYNDNVFDIIQSGLNLYYSNQNYDGSLEEEVIAGKDYWGNDRQIAIGKYKQEQATILAWYLIDAANDYADSVKDKYWRLEGDAYWQENRERLLSNYSSDEEKAMEHAKAELASSHISDEMEISPIKVENESVQYKKENGKNIIGPIKIEKQREAKYELNNTISINNTEFNLNTNSNIYLSNNNGEKLNKTLNEVVGENFYITINEEINTNPMQPGNNTISFSGNYHINEKTLWTREGATEQPIVEVKPDNRDINILINTRVPLEGKYNIVLVKEDQDGEQLNSKAEFKIKYPNNNEETKEVTGRLTIAENVEINQDNLNSSDIYVIEETKAPDRYSEFDGIIKLTIAKKEATDGKSYIIDKDNSNYIVKDKNGNQIENTDDVQVTFDGNNIKVEVKNHEKEFDLALQKYITSVISKDGSHEKEIRNAPQIDISKLNTNNDNGEKITTAQYTQAKNPINVINENYVLYTFTVYNEGELDGYVNKITDNIPKGLQFVYLNNNKVYAIDSTGNSQEIQQVEELVKTYIEANNSWWTIDQEANNYKIDSYNNDRTISVTCDVESYLRAKNIEGLNYLEAYDSSKNVNGSEGLDRLSVTLLLRVNSSEPKGTILRNEAAITEAEDKYHTKQDVDVLKDRDSKVTEWLGKDGEKKYQDDEDYDNVVLQDEPEIHKGVKEIYNQDSGYDENEEQKWVIESDIPENIEEYKKYDIVDDIDYRLKFSGIEKVEVKIGETNLVKDEDYTITYTENSNGVTNKTNSGTLKLVFIKNNQMSNKLKANSGDKIRVTFNTTFAKDENGKLLAELGTEVPNQANLEYTNSNGEEKVKKSEEPEVHTGGITLYKYEKEENSQATTNPIKDAEFTIYRTKADALAKTNGIITAISGEDGIVRFIGLQYGGDAKDSEANKTDKGIYDYDSSKQSTSYWVVETKVPEGYTGDNNPIEVIVNSTSYKEKATAIDYKVPNNPITGKYSVILVKEDQDGEQLNSKAEFKVNNQTREVIGRLTIVNNKEINKNNVDVIDVYTIEETKAPDRYSEFDGKITLQVSKKLSDDGKSYIVKDTTFTIVDKNGKTIENNKDVTVTLKENNIYVNVKNYEKDFDLKLMKFISAVNGKATDRKITIDVSKLNTTINNKKITTANYNVSKEPIEVRIGDYVTYTLRVYNEGEIDGYAKEITEDIPQGLKFITSEDKNLTEKDKEAINFNKARAWNVDNKEEDGTIKTVSTDYLSKTKSENNLIVAYAGDGKEPKYKDVQIMLKVVTDNSKIIRNEAAITDDEDKSGKEINDRDSDTEKWKKENSEDLYENNRDYPKYKEDDEDYDNIIVKNVDLALTKFIVAVSDDLKIEDGEYLTANKKIGSKENPYLRATSVDTTELKKGTATTAKYIMVKDPLLVPAESYVLYNIRVYNEGQVDIYAGEIKDHLPDYLDYVDCEFNKNYGWKVGEKNKIISTDYLSYAKGKDNLIKAFDKETDDGKGSGLSYKDVQILCRVSEKAKSNEQIKNVAEVSKYEDKDGNEIDKDIDSTPDNGEKNEDDDDYEVVLIKNIDLALTKFIVAISEDTKIEDGEYLTANKKIGSKENPYLRATSVDTTELKKGTATTAKYIMVKDPLLVPAESYVLYNIRVYNEGEVDVYAGEIKDHLPEYLEYVDCEFNKNYEWKVSESGNIISTDYLSYAKGKENLIKAFDKETDDGKGSGLSYKDVQILCKVSKKAKSNEQIKNVAEVSKYEDKDGNEIDKDIDSTPDNGDKNEDDDDYEVVLIKTFDLSLIKFVSEVIVTEDGKTKTTATNNTGDNKKDIIPKVEVNKKKIDSTIVKFKYKIKVTNEGDIKGYAKEITDYVPHGLKFYKEDNQGWTDEGNNIISTKLLENTLLKPGESAEVTVTLRWINGSTNLGLKRNNAEISEDYNKEQVPDRDSTPDNKIPEEDDFDYADVLLSISTGIADNIAKYILGSTLIITVLTSGIILIKKFVL